MIVKLRRKGLSWDRISKILSNEYEYKVSPMSVGRILKDVHWMRKERRRINGLHNLKFICPNQ